MTLDDVIAYHKHMAANYEHSTLHEDWAQALITLKTGKTLHQHDIKSCIAHHITTAQMTARVGDMQSTALFYERAICILLAFTDF